MEVSAYEDVRIPIVVGVTGHRNIRAEDVPALTGRVRELLRQLQSRHPHSPVTVLSSLAEGADQLCAEVALQEGCGLTVPLPMEQSHYLQSFSPEGARCFHRLLSGASSVFVVPAEEETPPAAADGFFYRQAGIYVAMHSHILLALWNGKEHLAPEGGGTCETVDFMLRESWRRTSGESLPGAPRDGIVWHVFTPRQNDPVPQKAAGVLAALSGGGLEEQWPHALAETDRYNADMLRHRERIQKHLAFAQAELTGKGGSAQEPPNRAIHAFCAADCLATYYRDLRLRALRWLSGLGTLLVLVFLLYDELESDLMLPFYALTLAAAFFIFQRSRSREYHRKYVHYRLLAEALRVGFYWREAGLPDRVWEQYTWAQKQDVVWIKEALAALDVAAGQVSPSAERFSLLRECWIRGQQKYHAAARAGKEKQLVRNRRISGLLLAAAVGLFALVFVLEFFGKDWMTVILPTQALESVLWMHPGQDITLRGALKILLGAISAGTALLSNYFGKLSLSTQAGDNAKMAELYGLADRALDTAPNGGEARLHILYLLGREAVVENGNWLLNYLEQAPDIIL